MSLATRGLGGPSQGLATGGYGPQFLTEGTGGTLRKPYALVRMRTALFRRLQEERLAQRDITIRDHDFEVRLVPEGESIPTPRQELRRRLTPEVMRWLQREAGLTPPAARQAVRRRIQRERAAAERYVAEVIDEDEEEFIIIMIATDEI